MTNSVPPDPTGSVAVIGMSGRFPGAGSVDQFWDNVAHGVESICVFSDDEVQAAGVDAATATHKNYVKAGGFLDGIEWFDASFFGFSPREAETMDPQHRLFLECAWEALENAGYDPQWFNGLVGVYGGTAMSTYASNFLTASTRAASLDDFQFMIGNDKDYLTTRVSYKLNLRGPSVSVQTACSTSLVAVVLACQGLTSYQCDMALAGGVGISVPQKRGYLHREGGILSPDGHCRAFDAAARGTVAGSGIGIVALKRLEDALESGDWIRAIIRGSALNNDGSAKIGFTAPAVDGQAQVIAMAQAMAGVRPDSIGYVEAHGTGTPLGDPIEIAALTQVFRARTDKKGFCAIGSVKTNIGHLDPAAGAAGFIKTVLALEHRQLPPSLHFHEPNPSIDFANSPFYVNTTLRDWPAGSTPRRAGVSSFGIGGTNAHVVLEEAPVAERSTPARSVVLLTVSARSAAALETAATNLAAHLDAHPDLDLADVAYVQHVGRKAFMHRQALVCRCDDARGASEGLRSRHARRQSAARDGRETAVRFLFPGQGAQHVGMLRDLYASEPVFREHVDHCAAVLDPLVHLDLRSAIYPNSADEKRMAAELDRTVLTQPALFAVEYALARLWMSWGVRPQAMIGHSIGEYVAACLAGVFSMEEALTLVAARGRLMGSVEPGVMLAVPLPEAQALELVGDRLSLAVVNAPSLCVIAGPADAVSALEATLAASGIEGRRLQTSHAFHSTMMEPILEAFADEVRQVTLRAPEIPYISNLTGTWATPDLVTDPTYWARHIRQTVRFDEGLREMMKSGEGVLLEVGPNAVLSRLAKQHPEKGAGHVVLPSARDPRSAESDSAMLLGTLGQLWTAGCYVDWPAFHAHEQLRRVPLPTYPFERERYWIDVDLQAAAGAGAIDVNAVPLRAPLDDWFYTPTWKLAPLPVAAAPSGLSRSRWLVFDEGRGLGSRVAHELRALGGEVVTVGAADELSQVDPRAYTLNPGRRSDYDTLIATLAEADWHPDAVMHLWNVARDDELESDAKTLDRARDLGFHSLLFLAQAFGRERVTAPLFIGVVSSHVQAVTGDEIVSPAKATLLGPCRVIPQEYPNITCRSLDIVLPPRSDDGHATLARRIVAELGGDQVEPVVAFRRSRRCVLSFDPLPLAAAAARPTVLRERGVYLVTGGLGGIGLALADYLATHVQARLVLTSRSGLPSRDDWDRHLAGDDPPGDVGRTIRRLRALEEKGAEVLPIRANVGDRGQMRMAAEQWRARFGAVHGVIHCAGVAGGGVIQLKTPEAAAAVWAPKVEGLIVLDELFEAEPLDFFVTCSSLASLVGGFGQVDYCAANAFIDAVAHRDGARGRRTTAINWDTWREVGMTVKTAVPRELEAWREASLLDGITPEEGSEAFGRILDTGLPQVAVSTKPIEWLTAAPTPDAIPAAAPEPTDDPAATARHPRPSVTTPFEAAQTAVERAIVGIWEELLGIDGIGRHDSFFELGGHSLLAIQVNSRLADAFGIELSMQQVFDAPTVAQLSATIEKASPDGYADAEAVARALEQVEQLSESEVNALLTARERPTIEEV